MVPGNKVSELLGTSVSGTPGSIVSRMLCTKTSAALDGGKGEKLGVDEDEVLSSGEALGLDSREE